MGDNIIAVDKTSASLYIINMTRKITNLNVDYIISEYAKGIGVVGIAKALGVSARPVARVLTEKGITLRGRSAQQQARMDRTTTAERKKLVSKANIANRGRKVPNIEREKVIATRIKRGNLPVSQYETTLAAMFEISGIKYESQVQFGIYACDFVVNGVIVEVWGGQWHFSGEHLAKSPERFKYLLDCGMNCIILPVNRSFPLNSSAYKTLVANINELSTNPPPVCEYRMIWGDTNLVTKTSLDCEHFTFECPFVNLRDKTTGRYSRVRR